MRQDILNIIENMTIQVSKDFIKILNIILPELFPDEDTVIRNLSTYSTNHFMDKFPTESVCKKWCFFLFDTCVAHIKKDMFVIDKIKSEPLNFNFFKQKINSVYQLLCSLDRRKNGINGCKVAFYANYLWSEELIKKQENMLAFGMASLPRLAQQSPVRMLPNEMLKKIHDVGVYPISQYIRDYGIHHLLKVSPSLAPALLPPAVAQQSSRFCPNCALRCGI